MSSTVRETALDHISTAQPVAPLPAPEQGKALANGYGCDVFNTRVMRQRLPREVYDRLMRTMTHRTPLDPADADIIAGAMKDWALEHGATHYTHWFQPMTGLTAEKHDAFLSPTADGQVFGEFSGKMLIKGEPDASSFPSGGIRSTFEARGYTAWDPTSPVFLLGDEYGRKTLYIPTVFYSYTGEALDRKTPLMRSVEAVSAQALRILRLLGNTTATGVQAMVGSEQEYFLVDRRLYVQRPDLMMCGRTLYGAKPAKGQEMEDHYFGSIPSRVLAYMQDVEQRLFALGIPAHTRHNEVAPGQFEIAPVYEDVNIATDHNMLTMEVMRRTARRHGYVCLLHEKPFAGVNGSGKHNNWSLGTDTGVNLLSPGKTASENLQFITFLVNVISAVHKHNGLLKAAIMSATNSHRLGANEAPPAIISTFLGTQVSAVLDKLEASRSDSAIRFNAKNVFKMSGISHIPALLRDNTDRNRTSAFAFTGNRFELRAVGSSDNCAEAMIVLNTAVADEFTAFRERVDARIEAGVRKEKAIYEELKSMIRSSRAIRFDGNGYSEEWRAEAARRGLDCETCAPRVFDRYLDPSSVEMFARMGVLSKVELEARTEVKWETYTKKIQIEGRVLGDLTMNHIVPIASRYEALLLDKVYKISQIGQGLDASADVELIKRIQQHTALIQQLTHDMIEARKVANKIEDQREKALAYHDTVAVYFDQIRKHVDRLEEIVDDQMWPLPKYRELLFLR